MKNSNSVIISSASVIVAVCALTYAAGTVRKLQSAETEAKRQRGMAPVPAETPAAPRQEPRTIYLEDSGRVDELEAELAAVRAELETARENSRSSSRRRESWSERMARMKEEDPEGYAEMIRERSERRSRMRYNLAERTAKFVEVDTAFMSDAERENHEQLVDKMGQIWALTEQFQNPEQSPGRETMRELHSLVQEARPMMESERSTMFRQLAVELGMEGEDAQAFTGYIEDIIETTTMEAPHRGRRGGGR